jgi:phospholipid-binding lipoprotein MlaA
MMVLMNKKMLLSLLLMMPLLGACASADNQESSLESFNRNVFAFNEAVDTVLFKPVAQGYRFITPDPLRERIGNMADNLGEPVTMINALLQGDIDRTVTSFWRFIINSTIGIAGLNDVAADAGLTARREDFGQTLAAWGWEESDYVVLPLIGPSTTRDTLGFVVDIFFDPLNYYLQTEDAVAVSVAEGLITRERLLDPIDDIYATSLDPYSSFQSIYLQRRASSIRNRKSSKTLPILNLN